MITLDGVMQAPGGPKEDTSGGFNYGGWTEPYGDEVFGNAVQRELKQPADYLLGRKTFKIWPTTGLNMETSGRVLMREPNMCFPKT